MHKNDREHSEIGMQNKKETRMNKSETTQKSQGWHKAGLVLILALATVTAFAADVHNLSRITHEPGGPPIYVKIHSVPGGLRAILPAPLQSADQFRWAGRVAQGKSIEIKNINGDISAE